MTMRTAQKATRELDKLIDLKKKEIACHDGCREWISAAWRPGRRIGCVVEWLQGVLDFLRIEEFTPAADMAEYYDGGWFYRFAGDIDTPWKDRCRCLSESWVIDDITGPFDSREAARQDILPILREMADDHFDDTDEVDA